MSTTPVQKNPANKTPADWLWGDIVAALHGTGWSLRQIGIEEGYPDGRALGEVARRPYPKAEAILARYLGVAHPMLIWPSRYDSSGLPNRRKGLPAMRGRKPIAQATTAPARRNAQIRVAK